MERSEAGLLDGLFVQIRQQLSDISYVEVITAAGDPKTEIDPKKENILNSFRSATGVRILARTRMQLDGDVVTIMPVRDTGEISINKEVMDMHERTVQISVENWSNFVKNVLTTLEIIASLTGLSKDEMSEKLGIAKLSR